MVCFTGNGLSVGIVLALVLNNSVNLLSIRAANVWSEHDTAEDWWNFLLGHQHRFKFGSN